MEYLASPLPHLRQQAASSCCALVWLLIFALLLPPSARAQDRQDAAAIEAAVQQLLETETAGQPGETQISVTPFGDAEQLPACPQLEAWLPDASRPWGNVRVGVRCQAPSPWTVWVQARVRVFGDYLVSRQALRSGHALSASDIDIRHGELSALPDNVLTAPTQIAGQLTRFAVAAGAPLRASNLRAAASVVRGQRVLVTTSGAGFSVSTEAQALNDAAPGERLRLRLPNGQIVNATAQPDGSASIEF